MWLWIPHLCIATGHRTYHEVPGTTPRGPAGSALAWLRPSAFPSPATVRSPARTLRNKLFWLTARCSVISADARWWSAYEVNGGQTQRKELENKHLSSHSILTKPDQNTVLDDLAGISEHLELDPWLMAGFLSHQNEAPVQKIQKTMALDHCKILLASWTT